MTPRHRTSFLNRSQMAGLGALLLLALVLAVLPACALIRSARLVQPLEFFLLSEHMTSGHPVPYADPTGAITGHIAAEPGLIIERVEDIAFEIRQVPVLRQGRVAAKERHLFARLQLLKRDRKRLEKYTAPALGSVLLVRVAEQVVLTTFLTETIDGEEFVVSGPDTPETRAALALIQATRSGGAVIGGVNWDK